MIVLSLSAAALRKVDQYTQYDNLMWAWAQLQSTWTISTGVLLAFAALFLAVVVRLMIPSKRKVYLLDFAVHKPAESWKLPRSGLRKLCEDSGLFSPEDIDFQEKVINRSGLGDDVSVTPGILSMNFGMSPAREEFEACCFAPIQEVLDKSGVKPSQIKFVISNSSLFNPTPSLTATIMNHFKMGKSTINYSLGGMGCSAGVIALDLARQMLELHPDSYALVVSHENITNAWYDGNDRSMMVPNCIFRANGSAILLSNKRKDARRSKYWLQHLVRTNLAADEEAFRCVVQCEDDQKKIGVALRKELMAVAGRALKTNMTTLGPLVLPYSEQLIFAANMVVRKLTAGNKAIRAQLPATWLTPYVPDFTKAFDHVCLHTGGRGVIDTIEKQLGMSKEMVEPSRAALYQYGNTSSTSIWYVLSYIESFKGLKAGDKVWQVGFGSGFKCNSAVWVANRSVSNMHRAWETFDSDRMYADLAAMDEQLRLERERKAAQLKQQ
eukprot:jgi/Chrzof1/3687/Cz13g05060.t1_LCKAS4[v5.2]